MKNVKTKKQNKSKIFTHPKNITKQNKRKHQTNKQKKPQLTNWKKKRGPNRNQHGELDSKNKTLEA